MAYRRRVEEPAPAVAVEAAAAAVERMGWTRVSDMRGGVLASEEEEQQQEEEDSYGDLPSERCSLNDLFFIDDPISVVRHCHDGFDPVHIPPSSSSSISDPSSSSR
jgi:hypothetical protein